MIIILKKDIADSDKAKIKKHLKDNGYIVKEIVGKEETVFGAVGLSRLDPRSIELMEGVSKVIPISKPYKLASRELKKEDTIVKLKNVSIGGNRIAVIAGPCAVESEEQIMRIAKKVREAGAVILRGGAYKPRTSPYSFQGLGEEGLRLLKKAGDAYGLPITSEVVSPKDVPTMAKYVDMFQIGARNMQNFELLKEVGKTGMPVLLKRGLSATIEEWLMAAEYLMASGTDQVVLCERGIRTFEKATRNTLDCSAIPVVQKLTHLPVIGDPSHATGIRDMVSPMALSLIAGGASGIMVEVHDHPECALSDGPQSLLPEQFEKLMRDIEALCPVVNKALEKIPRFVPSTINEESAALTDKAEDIVAFQGERGAFSELAVRMLFSEEEKVKPCETFRAVFDALRKKEVKYGVIPVENTLGGTIYENIDLLRLHKDVRVAGEIQVRIIHNLIVNKGVESEDIRKIYSHPQGLAQCKEYLDRHFEKAERIPFFDTAGAVTYIKKEKMMDAAAIAGSPAAKYNDMEILATGIETDPKNYTRFYVISMQENLEEFLSRGKPDMAAMSITVADESGSLLKVLDIFKKNNMNMKKLESRPILGRPWEYSLFIEVEFEKDSVLYSCLDDIKAETTSFVLHGVFEKNH